MKKTIEIKVRGYHLDMFAHVNNARYLEFIEEGRWDFFEQEPAFLEFVTKNNLIFPLVNINIDYKYSAGVGDILQVVTCLKKIGNRSVTVEQKIYIRNKNLLAIDAEVTFVFIDNKTGKSIQIPDELKKQWMSLIPGDEY